MKCLVTGATGFVGRALCERLSTNAIDFIAISRSGGTLVNGQCAYALDLEVSAVPPQWLAGVETVFHLAGIAHRDAAAHTYEAVNYRATLDLAAAAAAAGVKNFIYLSSVKAMGSPSGADPRSEDQCVPATDPYGYYKRQAELGLQVAYENSAMSVVVLRPALVYGAGAAGNLQLLAKAARAGIPRPPELGGRSMIAVDDMAALLVALVREPAEGFHLWIVCDGNSYSASKVYALMQSALGREPSRSWLPLWVWRCACALRDLVGRNPRGTSYIKVFGSENYSNTELLAAVNWRPAYSFEDTVEQIMRGPGTGR
ncbi:MAG: nucleoside-diphosphate-sugar epimerase [Halioglobus sp.]|jgi:nucleoside-diphosphate-sugar epimerase